LGGERFNYFTICAKIGKNKNQEQPLSLHAARKKQRAFPWKVGGGAAALVNIMCRHSLCGLTMKEIT
jgi:hypothetical protein